MQQHTRMYEGATENDPLLKATTIKYEQRYSHQMLHLNRSLIVFLITLSLVFVFDIARLIMRKDTYDPGNGNMLPQAIMVVLIGAFVAFFKHKEKTSLLVVVHITVLMLFFLFSLAILPSFIKEILIDFDVLCPVMIGLTGLTAIICIVCIVIAYKFLKFHRKYMKRKATLPVVLQASPDWQNPYVPQHGSSDLAGVASVLFPTYQPDPKMVQEQWEKFQQSRLYLPENRPQPRSPRPPRAAASNLPPTPAIPPPLAPSPAVPPTPVPGQPTLTAQERWERFQRSPIFHSVNHGETTPEIGRARKPSYGTITPEARAQQPTPGYAPTAPHPPPPIQPQPTAPPFNTLHQDEHRPSSQNYPTSPPTLELPSTPSRREKLSRNPSFRYGAYVHEPVAFRAHPDDTPEEYTQVAQYGQHTQLSQHTRSESLPNIVASAQQQQQQQQHVADEPIPLEAEADRYDQHGYESIGRGSPPPEMYPHLSPRESEVDARKDKRLSLPAHAHSQPHARSANSDNTSVTSRSTLPPVLE